MKQIAQVVGFEGAVLRRGFWLYVWEIVAPSQAPLYYVGRTGDSSSRNAQSPFNRMSQHLGFNKRSNVLRRRLNALGIQPDKCKFRLIAYGPIEEEAGTVEAHRKTRDHIAALEKALADAMVAAGYNVINPISCRASLDDKVFATVHAEFEKHFSQLACSRAAP
jgi:hypothetical protein